ncbi:hypothetical protein BX666DRAFT_1930157 [Dichotomocladium elegans]|nr:hypothetical protein BX666DRAFT_1930157 [Dichotomocladium elegans]
MVMFWPRQSNGFLANAGDHAMETLHKACLAALDAVLRLIVVEITGQKKQQQSSVRISMLDSIRFSLNGLGSRNSSTQLHHILEEVDLLLLHDRCLLTTATLAQVGRALAYVLHRLNRSTDYPSSCTTLEFTQVCHDLLIALNNAPVTLDPYTRPLMQALTLGEDEEPPAYHASNDYATSVGNVKPPKYDDELDYIMSTLSRHSLHYDKQRVDLAHRKEQTQSLADLLAKSQYRPELYRQRYTLSATKERDLFLIGLFHKIDRLQSRRLSNQDAELPKHGLDLLLHHIARTKRPGFDNQRAAFSFPSSA